MLEELVCQVSAGHTGRGSVARLAACVVQGQLLVDLGQGLGLSLTIPTPVYFPRVARST